MTLQNISDRLIGYLMAQIGQRPHNPVIAPGPILLGHANNQRLDLSVEPGPARGSTSPRAIELAGDEFTSGYTESAIFHYGRLDPGVLFLSKPYRKCDLARMVRAARMRRMMLGVSQEKLGDALAVGCIVAATTGHVELGLPCVVTGGVSSAALSFWDKQQ